jgi:hypothetical protein
MEDWSRRFLTALAKKIVLEELAKACWREMDLAKRPKGHHLKIKIAHQLRIRTSMHQQ